MKTTVITPPPADMLMMLVSAGRGLAFQRRVETGGISTHTAGPQNAAPAWVKLERRGNTLTASHSLDGVTWQVVGTDTLALPQSV